MNHEDSTHAVTMVSKDQDEHSESQTGWIGVILCAVAVFVGGWFCLTNNGKSSRVSSATADVEKQDDNSPSESAGIPATDDDLKSFDQVWETVRDKHWEEDYGGVDWNAARDELRPKAEAAKTRGEVRVIIGELIDRLGQSHFGVIPGEVYASTVETDADESDEPNDGVDDEGHSDPESTNAKSEDDADVTGERGEAGFDIRLRHGQLMVVRVAKDSGAEKAGIQPGWTLQKVRGRDAKKIMDSAKKATEHGPMRMDTLVAMMGERVTRGYAGRKLKFIFEDLDGASKDITVKLGPVSGTMAAFGHLPPMRVTHSTVKRDDGVVVFTFNLFFDPMRVMSAFKAAVEDAREAKGLIIDIRGNLGGIGAMTFGMASAFAEEEGKLGVMKTRESELKFPVFPPLEPYTGPVAVLIDECSISSAEILSGGLKDLGLARVFGNQTAGLALPSMVEKLPNGDALQYAFANYTSVSGKVLEGVGVEPHELLISSQSDFRESKDPVMTRAAQWILEQNDK